MLDIIYVIIRAVAIGRIGLGRPSRVGAVAEPAIIICGLMQRPQGGRLFLTAHGTIPALFHCADHAETGHGKPHICMRICCHTYIVILGGRIKIYPKIKPRIDEVIMG